MPTRHAWRRRRGGRGRARLARQRQLQHAGSSRGGAAVEAARSQRRTDVKLAYNADMQVPDPDIFYEIEGNSVTTSVYEGLVRYKPNSTEIEPALAESFDGLARRPDLHVQAARRT